MSYVAEHKRHEAFAVGMLHAACIGSRVALRNWYISTARQVDMQSSLSYYGITIIMPQGSTSVLSHGEALRTSDHKERLGLHPHAFLEKSLL